MHTQPIPSPAPPATSPSRPPGPRGWARIAALRGIVRDPLETIAALQARHGDLCMFDMPLLPRFHLLSDPDAIHHVLVDNARNYVKSRSYDGLRHLLGDGLLTSEGDFWRRQRRLAQPAFHRQRLEGLVAKMTADTAATLEGWRGKSRVDVHAEMTELTYSIVGHTLFGTDLAGRAQGVGDAFTEALRWANQFALQLVRTPASWPTPANRRMRRAMHLLDGVIDGLIAERRADETDRGDLMSMLILARDEETGERMDDRQLRAEVMTMVAAGHETTANATTWLFYLLAQHPEVEERLRAECDGVFGRGAPTIADLPRLRYTLMTVQETLRLYPPVWIFERTALADDALMGHRVTRGGIVGISPYVMHRHPRYWTDPERFDPERFETAAVDARPRFTYLPFGGGPRICIGNNFALMEAQIIAAMVVSRYRLRPASGAPKVEREASVTLRPRAGVQMTIEPV